MRTAPRHLEWTACDETDVTMENTGTVKVDVDAMVDPEITLFDYLELGGIAYSSGGINWLVSRR